MDFANTLLSDSDRCAALDALTEHFVDGRLSLAEFDHRSSGVLAARCIADLEVPFDGIPGGAPFVPGESGQPVLRDALVPAATTELQKGVAELEEVVRKGRVVDRVDSVVWTVCIGVFLGLEFFFDVDHAWLAIVAGLLLSVAARTVVGLDDDEEEHYEEIKEQEAEQRAARRKLAMERRAELET